MHPDTKFRDACLQAALVFLGFALPMPIVWGSLAWGLLALAWVFHGDFRTKLERLLGNAASWWALAFFLLVVVDTFHGNGNQADRLDHLWRYAKICLIPLVFSAVKQERTAVAAVHAFLLGLGVELAVSYARIIGVIAEFPDPNQRYIGLINHISFSLMLAFGLYLFTQRALRPTRWRAAWAVLALLAAINLMFFNGGRVGYLDFIAVAMLLFAQRRGLRGLLLGGAIGCLVLALAVWFSPTSRQRMLQIQQDIVAMKRGDMNTAIGLRAEHYRQALTLVRPHWILGGGTGSFKSNYQRKFHLNAANAIGNPENEWLIVAAEFGLVGVALLLGLGYRLWCPPPELAAEYRDALQALVVVMAVGCLFNSQLLDAPEGRFFTVMAGLLLAGPLRPHPESHG